MSQWPGTDCLLTQSCEASQMSSVYCYHWSTCEYPMLLILHSFAPCFTSAPWQREVGNTWLVTEAPVWGFCFFTFPTKTPLGFVSTAAATCSHPWPPQLSPLPRGLSGCGSLCTFTEHRWCRRQQRPAAPSPVALKIGESWSWLLYRGGGGWRLIYQRKQASPTETRR